VEDTHTSNDDALTDEVEINLNMFGVLMLDGVGGEVDMCCSRLEWPATGGCATPEATNWSQMEPGCLHHAVGNDVVLCLDTQSGASRTRR
jgi:hypothetical protein